MEGGQEGGRGKRSRRRERENRMEGGKTKQREEWLKREGEKREGRGKTREHSYQEAIDEAGI